jgi:imidazolonepropionase
MTTALVNIGQMVTVRPGSVWEVDVQADTSLTIRHGRIVASGAGPEGADRVVDAEGGVVLPGFIDAHTHLVFGGNRCHELAWKCEGKGYQEIAALGGGIQCTVRDTRAASEESLLMTGIEHLTWSLRRGTTTWESKSGYGLDLENELKLLFTIHRLERTLMDATEDRVTRRVFPTFLGLHAVGPEHTGNKSAYVDLMLEEVLPMVARAELATSVDAFVESGYFDHDDARRLATKAHEHGLALRLHVDQLTDNGGAALAAELGAVSADHLEQTGPRGIQALAKSGTVPVLLPGSVLGLGSNKYPDARSMIDHGLPVVLATDFNPGSSPTPSLPFVTALAVRQMRMTPEECLAAVTTNAARSLGLEDRGRLVEGQLADLSVWPIVDWREVMTWFDGPTPSSVWLSGVQVSGALG